MSSAAEPIPAGPRQQQRTQVTRDRILDTAVSLYLEHGVEATTISEIIKRSEVGRTTFYRYFKDQDEVLNQAVIRDFENLIADFDAQRFDHDDPAVQIIEDICWFHRQLGNRPALKLLFSNRAERFYHRLSLSGEMFDSLGTGSSRSTYELAKRKGMLREGITLEKYVEWSTFTLVALQTTHCQFAKNEFRLRDMLRDFFVPGLLNIDASTSQ